jgi:hypothetical protein
MRKIVAVFTLLFLFSCTEMVDKPKKLLSKEQMSAIIADFAIYDQAYSVRPDVNMEQASRYVLQKHKTSAAIYRDSYTYYLGVSGDLEGILEGAKEILINKDPKLEEYIQKQKKDNPNLPSFVK